MLMLFVALLAIAAGAACSHHGFSVRRDREEEMIHRGTQYSRAIRQYVKKTGRYPSRLEELENTNNIRFLRKRYKDPVTNKDFKLLHVGEVQLTGAAGIAGAAAIGGGTIPGAARVGAMAPGGAPYGRGRRPGSDARRNRINRPATGRTRNCTRRGRSSQDAGIPKRIIQYGSSRRRNRDNGRATSYPARFLAEDQSWASPASARRKAFANSITRIITTSGSLSMIRPWIAAD